jgi:hypothetical protein
MQLSPYLLAAAVTCAFNLCMMEDLKTANLCHDLRQIIALYTLKGNV